MNSDLASHYSSRYYSSAASSYLGGGRYDNSYSGGGRYSSRLRRQDREAEEARKEKEEQERLKKKEEEEEKAKEEDDRPPQPQPLKRTRPRHRATVINGMVTRIGRNSEDSSEDESSSDESSDEEEEEREPTPPPPPKTPTPPPPEDPLDVEERMLNAQLALSFTLTLTDEENIRQRLLEIRKTKMKREKMTEIVVAMTDKFEKEVESLGEKSRAKEEEQKILLTRYT